ncbi:MAG: CRISPR-associated protein Cas4 [Spirochaetes bacterium]|nr:CRISPR-associated protein Cas4 [Spirochaetota bacterium]
MTGMYINYYFLCQKKLWLFSHNICFENTSEDVSIGKFISENTYERKLHEIHIINYENEVAIDFYDRKRKVIHEVKKSRKMEELHKWQVKYYIYVLNKNGIPGVKGEIDYPKLKRIINVELTEDDIKELDNAIKDINLIICNNNAPKTLKKPYCKKCSYYEFCYC